MSGWIGERVDAVIFDHDGTLVDSEPITLGVVAEMAVEAGAEVYPEDADRFVGADLHVVIEEIGRRSGSQIDLDPFLAEFRVRQTAGIEEGLLEVPGADELLRALIELDVPIAVASNAPVVKVELCLRTTGLLDYFHADRLFSAYQVNAWKPNPAVFLHAAKEMGFAPENCAVVEDSESGVQAGIAAGMTVFALDPNSKLPAMDGVAKIKKLTELVGVLT